jgi:hypothetical protein
MDMPALAWAEHRHDRLDAGASLGLRERTVPLHPEAAEAIRDLVALRDKQRDRGLYDRDVARRVRYLFLHNGGLATVD